MQHLSTCEILNSHLHSDIPYETAKEFSVGALEKVPTVEEAQILNLVLEERSPRVRYCAPSVRYWPLITSQ